MNDFIEGLRAAAAKREAAGQARSLRPRPADPDAIDLAGNDYLGLARHPRVGSAAADAAREWGAGSTGSRLVTGALDIHGELEAALADFCRQPGALLFSSGYLANLGVVTALSRADTLIVSDAHVHASLVDACRLSGARKTVVPHNDVAAVAEALAQRAEPHALVLVESIYSVLGDEAPLAELADVAQQFGAVLVADEAHAIGVAGPNGRGLVAAHGLSGRPDVVVTLTLSKALGAQGGVVLAALEVIDHVVNTARPFIYDTGLSPSPTAAALAALRVVQDEPDRIARLHSSVAELAALLGRPTPAGAVFSIPVRSPDAAVAAAARLRDTGVSVGCFRPPSVPDGISRLRITASASLTPEQLKYAGEQVAAALDAARVE